MNSPYGELDDNLVAEQIKKLGWKVVSGSLSEGNLKIEPPGPNDVSPERFNECARSGLKHVLRGMPKGGMSPHDIALALADRPDLSTSTKLMLLAAALSALKILMEGDQEGVYAE